MVLSLDRYMPVTPWQSPPCGFHTSTPKRQATARTVWNVVCSPATRPIGQPITVRYRMSQLLLLACSGMITAAAQSCPAVKLALTQIGHDVLLLRENKAAGM